MKKKERKATVRQVIGELWQEALWQLFGWGVQRRGRLEFTGATVRKMHELQIDAATIRDVFRFGQHVDKGDKVQVVRQYQHYAVGLWYKTIYTPYHHNLPSEKKYLVITCWKGVSN